MKAPIVDFVARRWSVPRDRVQVDLRPLRGGLESTVARATVAVPSDSAVPRRFIVKSLSGGHRRESRIYRSLWSHCDSPPIARVIGVQASGGMEYLLLEELRGSCSWPWSDTGVVAESCRALARLHDTALPPRSSLEWNYEEQLEESAAATLDLALRARGLWRGLGHLKRAVAALPEIRARLRESERTLIHGDMHPGNVIVRGTGRKMEIKLLDWGRARVGSPLEDIASWLHSLGCWEPRARQRHDSLLRVYLESRGVPRRITRELRRDYTFSSLSNGLAGAIRYHLAVLGDPSRTGRARSESRQALDAWQRVVRRASELLRASPAG